MRALVISDIHANLPAFEAVLAAAPPYDVVWNLGDLVGYGANPNEWLIGPGNLAELWCVAITTGLAASGHICSPSSSWLRSGNCRNLDGHGAGPREPGMAVRPDGRSGEAAQTQFNLRSRVLSQ